MLEPMRDLIVLLPGILGSELQKGGRSIWGWSGRAVLQNLFDRGAGYSADLAVIDDASPEEQVVATGLLPDLHMIPGLWKIDGYGAIADHITSEFDAVEHRNFCPFPYDWRRDNRLSAQLLKSRTDQWLHRWRNQSGNKEAKLILIAHSMGGLVARYFLEVLEGWRDTKALITFGTPFRGSLNAVDALANGMKMWRIDLTALVRSLKSVYQLLPTYECVDSGSGKLRRVADGGLPNANAGYLQDAFEFHERIRAAVEEHQKDEAYRQNRYRIYPIIGYRQPTKQSVRIQGDGVELLDDIRVITSGKDRVVAPEGDGTVPRPSALPLEEEDGSIGMFAATRHAALQNADAVLTHLSGVLLGLDLPMDSFRAARPQLVQLSLQLDDAYRANEPIIVRARATQGGVALGATFVDVESGLEVARLPMTAGRDGWHSLTFAPPRIGAYRVSVSGHDAAVEPAADVFEVLEIK
jgi:pimeloyl-ACP methyl ester carboxylesterase